MKSESNHMDEWLKGSAEMGNIPFNEGDWQHMQELLRKPRKRRFIVWWWLLLLLFCGITATWIVINKEEQPAQTATKEITDSRSKDNMGQQVNGSTSSSNAANVSDKDISGSINNDKQELINEPTNKTEDDHNTIAVSASSAQTGPVKNVTKHIPSKTETLPVRRKKLKTSSGGKANASFKPGAQDTMGVTSSNSNQPYTDEPIIDKEETLITIPASDSIKNDVAIVNIPREEKGGEEIKSIDTAAGKIENKVDTSSKKRDTGSKNKRKPQLFLSGMYSNGNVPVTSRSIGAELLYSVPLGKKFSINASVSTAKIRINEQQVHDNIKSITPVGGSTMIVVNKKTTVFSPLNGISVAAGLTIAYKAGKWQFSSGVQRGFVSGKDNRIDKVTDTFYFYTAATLPPGIKVGGGNYKATDFAGKQFLTASIGARYYFGRFHAGFNFNQQLWNNKVEGVTTDTKKRIALNFLLGMRL